MPLRDHFRPPIDDISSWEQFHGQGPAMIVLDLVKVLPRRYVAGPNVHAGAVIEVDVAAFEKEESPESFLYSGAGGVATAVWAPCRPTVSIETVCRRWTTMKSVFTTPNAPVDWSLPSKSSARQTKTDRNITRLLALSALRFCKNLSPSQLSIWSRRANSICLTN